MTYQDDSEGMGMGGSHTVSAFYDDRSDAEAAVERLRMIGVFDSQVRLTQGQQLAGTDGGTEDQGFFAMLGELFFPSEDRSAYAEGLNRGGTLLTVSNVSESAYDDVLDILDDEGAVDMDERTASWRDEGWSEDGYGEGRGPAGQMGGLPSGAAGVGGLATAGGGSDVGSAGMGRERDMGPGSDETLDVVEERLRVGKRDASRGTVRVRSYVVEEPVSETINLRDERVEVERRAVDRSVTGGDDVFQDRSIEAEEYREEAVVSKDARVVEEIGLRRVSDEREETVSDTLRHTEVEIEDDRDDTLPSGETPRR